MLKSVDISFAPGLRPVLKHLPGQHDQKTHGQRGGRTITSAGQMADAWDEYIGDTIPANYNENTLKASVAQRITDRMGDVSTADLISASGLLGTNVEADLAWGQGAMDAKIKTALTPDDSKMVGFDYDGNLMVEDTDGMSWEDIQSGSTDLLGRVPYPAGSSEAEILVREFATSRMVSRWAQTSNGQDPRALAFQEAAAKEFGVKDYAPWDTEEPVSVISVLSRDGAVMQKFARAQYDETQSMFRDLGISEVVVYRGKTVLESNLLGEAAIRGKGAGGSKVSVQTRPLSSWSVSQSTAKDFAWERFTTESRPWDEEFKVPVMIRSTIPVSSILATCVSGVGSWAEKEIVTVGSVFEAKAIALEDDFDVGFE